MKSGGDVMGDGVYREGGCGWQRTIHVGRRTLWLVYGGKGSLGGRGGKWAGIRESCKRSEHSQEVAYHLAEGQPEGSIAVRTTSRA